MSAPAVTTTRDLIRYRKLPSSQTALNTLASNFFAFLATPDSPPAALVRSGFLPALLATDARPRDASQAAQFDDEIRTFFCAPPNVVVVQGIITPDQISQAWSTAPKGGPVGDSVFVAFALNQEVESAKSGGEREEEANINMMILATLTYELAHWIHAKTHGYTESQATTNDGCSISSFGAANSSVTSLQSLLVMPGSSSDSGVRAVTHLFGFTYELLSYAIGERQLVKRRAGTRRTPALTPPLVYQLIGDTPAILDVTQYPATHARWIVPWKEGDPMYAVVSALTPFSSPDYHGVCKIRGGDGPASEYSVTLAGAGEREEGKF